VPGESCSELVQAATWGVGGAPSCGGGSAGAAGCAGHHPGSTECLSGLPVINCRSRHFGRRGAWNSIGLPGRPGAHERGSGGEALNCSGLGGGGEPVALVWVPGGDGGPGGSGGGVAAGGGDHSRLVSTFQLLQLSNHSHLMPFLGATGYKIYRTEKNRTRYSPPCAFSTTRYNGGLPIGGAC
jgi:hypothetical protein